MGTICLVALAATLPTAAASAGSDETLTPSGSLTYRWQASPALGCEAEGLCGVHGAVTVDVQSADYQQAAPFQPRQLLLQLVATARTQGVGPGSSCVDVLDVPELSLSVPQATGLGRTPFAAGGLSAGRCAGPLMRDLTRLTVPVRRRGGRRRGGRRRGGARPSFDLRATRTESAGPYVVTLRSTLALRPADNGNGSSSSSSSGGPPPGARHAQLEEQVVLGYRPGAASGTVQASFRAAPEPFCDTLGACGSTGTISLSIGGAAHRPISIEATRLTSHRVSRARALADLRAGRLQLASQGELPVTVSETVKGGQAPTCTDTRHESLPLDLSAPGPGAPGVQLDDLQGEALRTYCPGPLNADLLPAAASAAIAQGPLDPSLLARPQITVALARSTPFAGPAYAGRWSGNLMLPLARTTLRASTVKVRF